MLQTRIGAVLGDKQNKKITARQRGHHAIQSDPRNQFNPLDPDEPSNLDASPSGCYLANSFARDGVEEVRLLEIERQINLRPDWRKRLRGNSRGDVVLPRAGVDERLVAKGLD